MVIESPPPSDALSAPPSESLPQAVSANALKVIALAAIRVFFSTGFLQIVGLSTL
jgi:hypothetical protein